jgi:hypothetical protein
VQEKHPADVTQTMALITSTNRWPLLILIDAEITWREDRGQSRHCAPSRARRSRLSEVAALDLASPPEDRPDLRAPVISSTALERFDSDVML